MPAPTPPAAGPPAPPESAMRNSSPPPAPTVANSPGQTGRWPQLLRLLAADRDRSPRATAANNAGRSPPPIAHQRARSAHPPARSPGLPRSCRCRPRSRPDSPPTLPHSPRPPPTRARPARSAFLVIRFRASASPLDRTPTLLDQGDRQKLCSPVALSLPIT